MAAVRARIPGATAREEEQICTALRGVTHQDPSNTETQNNSRAGGAVGSGHNQGL